MLMRKECACGRRYDAETWSSLPFAGYQSKGTDRESAVFEMRTCPCGSTLAVEPDDSERRAAVQVRRAMAGTLGR